MSNNPFAPPSVTTGHELPAAGVRQPEKQNGLGGITLAILILTLIFGTMGILGSLWGFVGLAIHSVTQSGFQSAMDEMPESERAFQEALAAYQEKQFVPGIIQLIANCIVAPLLIVGAVGGLRRKRWGVSVLSLAYPLAVIYKLGGFALQLYAWAVSRDDMREALALANDDPAGQEFLSAAMTIGMTVGLAFTGIIALVLIAFYLFGLFHLRRANVRAKFS